MREIELKFVLDAKSAREVFARLARLSRTGRWQRLSTTYYDTPAGTLRERGVALRLRQRAQDCVQTVKVSRGVNGGLVDAKEFDAPAPSGAVSVEAIPDEATRKVVAGAINGAALEPVSTMVVRRNAGMALVPGGGRVDVALDVGTIATGEERERIHEVEFELVEGPPAALYDLAAEVVPEAGLRLSTLSKAHRAAALAQTGTSAPTPTARPAATIAITRGQTAEEAARDVLRECFAQVSANVAAVCHDAAPEGTHQLRVGLRRLRSALSLFSEPLASPELTRLLGEAKHFGRLASPLRDLDVAVGDLIAPVAAAHPSEVGFGALTTALSARADSEREVLRGILRSERTQRFLLALSRFIETRGWLMSVDLDQTRRLAEPVEDVAARVLDAQWQVVRRKAKGMRDLEIEARHDLRKSLKTLRYTVEFTAPLYAEKAVAPFLKALRRLQDDFGALNDLAVAEVLLSGRDAPGATDPAAQRATGWLLGRGHALAETDWDAACTHWRNLKATEPYWTA